MVCRTTHPEAILSVRDINMEVWEIMEGQIFIELFYFILAHLYPRYKKMFFSRGFAKQLLMLRPQKLFLKHKCHALMFQFSTVSTKI